MGGVKTAGRTTRAGVDPDVVRRRIRADGFAALPGLLPADPVVDLRRQVGEVLASHDWLAPGTAVDELVPEANRRDGSPGWWRMYEDLQRLEALHRLAHHPALGALARALVGRRVLNHPRRYLSLIPPQFRVPPHQQHLTVQGTPDVLTAWIPLTDFERTTSTLHVLRGARPLQPLTTEPGIGGAEATAPPPDDPAWWYGERLVPGDVVIIHGLTLWGCDENLSGNLAGALLARFQSARLPICPASLEPHHYPRLVGWPVLTEGWSTRRWVRTPWPRRTVPFVLADIETWHECVPPRRPTLVDIHRE